MLVPTCSIALTRPSIMGVSSGFSEGNASTASLARRRATAESNNKRVLLIPNSFFSGAKEEEIMLYANCTCWPSISPLLAVVQLGPGCI